MELGVVRGHREVISGVGRYPLKKFNIDEIRPQAIVIKEEWEREPIFHFDFKAYSF